MRISPWCLALLACHAGLVSAASAPDQPSDQLLGFARERWYNPSLVLVPDGSAMCAIKDTKQVKKRSMGKPTLSRTVWVNRLYMCTGSAEDLNSLTCKPFDPWKTTRHRECEFGMRVRKGKLDTSGLGDVKVWRWPGKGVYAIFGRKPQRESSSWCEGLVVYHQWIAQVSADPGLKEDDPWHLNDGGPLAVLPDMTTHHYPGNPPYVMEKNWMPFLYTDPATRVEHLYVTYYVQPHIVFEVFPNGSALHRWTTPAPNLMAQFQHYDVHGGPPVVYVPVEQSITGQPHYLGIMHHIERFDNNRVRLYRHFLFTLAPAPPFAITAISDELPLVFNQSHKEHTHWVAFVSGLCTGAHGSVYITYGSADIQSRLLILSLEHIKSLFSGQIKFTEYDIKLQPSDAHKLKVGSNGRL